MALHALFKMTNEGAGWACKKGWDSVLEGDSSALFGVSTEGGRVTKISLGANGLEGAVTVVSFAKKLFLVVWVFAGIIPLSRLSLVRLRVAICFVAYQHWFYSLIS